MPVFSQNLSRAPRRLSVSSRQAAESPIAISPECSGTIQGGAGLALALCRFVPEDARSNFHVYTTLLCQEVKSSQVKSPKHKGHTCVGWPGDRDNLLSTHAVTRVSVTCGGEEGL